MMKYWKLYVFFVAILLISAPRSRAHMGMSGLKASIERIAQQYDANIGVAVISGDSIIGINADKSFPMLSVYKLPIALAVAEKCRKDSIGFDSSVSVMISDLRKDTYSPMLEKYTTEDSINVKLDELLIYALQQSDNNASDILLNFLGGANKVTRYLNSLGFSDIHVISTESEMYDDNTLCYANSATPIAIAKLCRALDCDMMDSLGVSIKRIMETCETGKDRLAAPLPHSTVLGHKTGTGFRLANGRLMAINDVGYVHLPNSTRYYIAVFVKDSAYDMETTSAIIARISREVLNELSPDK